MTLEEIARRANAVQGTVFTAGTLPKTTIGELVDRRPIGRLSQMAKDAWRRHRMPLTSTGRLSARRYPAA